MNTRNIESIQPWELLYVFVQLSRSDFLFTDLVSGNRVRRWRGKNVDLEPGIGLYILHNLRLLIREVQEWRNLVNEI